ncbi:hypothetical protein SAMN05444580_105355 [Rhodococcus tukisamuensis]|uniref:Uncharacterized protein n=1 Tax=Rhodococcus tukisamuensis TaxID=168276 RepID=A0A1G6WFY8_9NOCA|nr:hypothetical protein SAMN05444580_105355 [Rhodococcus tukisamuensis]
MEKPHNGLFGYPEKLADRGGPNVVPWLRIAVRQVNRERNGGQDLLIEVVEDQWRQFGRLDTVRPLDIGTPEPVGDDE